MLPPGLALLSAGLQGTSYTLRMRCRRHSQTACICPASRLQRQGACNSAGRCRRPAARAGYPRLGAAAARGQGAAEGRARRAAAHAAGHPAAGAQADRQRHVRLPWLRRLALLRAAARGAGHGTGPRDPAVHRRPGAGHRRPGGAPARPRARTLARRGFTSPARVCLPRRPLWEPCAAELPWDHCVIVDGRWHSPGDKAMWCCAERRGAPDAPFVSEGAAARRAGHLRRHGQHHDRDRLHRCCGGGRAGRARQARGARASVVGARALDRARNMAGPSVHAGSSVHA
jgi:hypothetical protein